MPVANVVQVVTGVPVTWNGPHVEAIPKTQGPGTVAHCCQLYTGTPFVAVNVPLVSTQTASVAHVLTVIEIELEPHANV